MIVHVAGVVLEPTRMLDGAHHAVVHGAGRYGGRRSGGMIHDRSRLLRAYLLHRPAHALHRSDGLMAFDGGTHRIGWRLAYDGVDRSHRLHGSHRLGRAHTMLERPHRRWIGRSARPLPASRHRRRAAATATVTLWQPTARVGMIHRERSCSRISQPHGPVRCHDPALNRRDGAAAASSRTVTREEPTRSLSSACHDASRRSPRSRSPNENGPREWQMAIPRGARTRKTDTIAGPLTDAPTMDAASTRKGTEIGTDTYERTRTSAQDEREPETTLRDRRMIDYLTVTRAREVSERLRKPWASAAATENRRIATPRSPALSLAASTAAQSLHANRPTDPLSSTATHSLATPIHPPPARTPSHTPRLRRVSSASITSNPSAATRLSFIPLDRNVRPPPPVQLNPHSSSLNSAAVPSFLPFPRESCRSLSVVSRCSRFLARVSLFFCLSLSLSWTNYQIRRLSSLHGRELSDATHFLRIFQISIFPDDS